MVTTNNTVSADDIIYAETVTLFPKDETVTNHMIDGLAVTLAESFAKTFREGFIVTGLDHEKGMDAVIRQIAAKIHTVVEQTGRKYCYTPNPGLFL